MPRISAAADIATIIDTSIDVWGLVHKWWDGKKRKLAPLLETQPNTSLTTSGPAVKREYDGHEAGIGHAFTVGDGT
jgi:hypothetical protein